MSIKFQFLYIQGGPKTPGNDDIFKRCVHFYACVCAFASDEKLQEEFAFYLDLNGSSEPSANTTNNTDCKSCDILCSF